MKKNLHRHKILLIIGTLLIIKLGIYYYDDFKNLVEKKAYNYYVNEFEKISPTDAVSLASQNKSEILIYFGRNTCPHCVRTIKNVYDMSKKAKKKKIPFYHIEEESALTEKDHELINDLFELKYIPSIVKISANSVEIFDYEEIGNKEFEKDFLMFLKSNN